MKYRQYCERFFGTHSNGPETIEPSYVYVIRQGETDYYKIGASINPKKRLSNLQTANPLPLNLVYKIQTNSHYEIESKIHDIFADKQVTGEWFEFTRQELITLKAEMQAAIGDNFLRLMLDSLPS